MIVAPITSNVFHFSMMVFHAKNKNKPQNSLLAMTACWIKYMRRQTFRTLLMIVNSFTGCLGTQHHIRSVAWEGQKLGLLKWVLSLTPFPAQYRVPIQVDPVQMECDGKYNERIMGAKTGTSYPISCTAPVSLLKLHFFEQNQVVFCLINQVLFLNKTVTSFLRVTKLSSCKVVKSETFNIDRERKFRFAFIMKC